MIEKHIHTYDPTKWSRDDSAFYLACECGHMEVFWVDTEQELLALFGIDDDADDYLGGSEEEGDN